jgi:hypothetical protein
MKTESRQIEHDDMLRAWVRKLESDGYAVEADLPEKQKPGLVYGHIPDLKALRDDHRIIGEVETCDSISWTETRDQFVAFTKARREGWEFHALTPESCVQDLEAQVADWRGQGYDVTVDRYWWI